MLLFSILLYSTYLPTNCLGFSFIFDVFFGKGGNIPRVRNIETARSLNRFAILDFIGLVERHGFPAEEHIVTTKDGYILKIHRIPGSASKPKSKGKPVVFLQHGILASSDTFVLMGPQRDLAFLLANIGYDVWLGNSRGNTYSRSHKKRSPDRDPQFWKFSYHEIAIYDVSATIDYILEETGESNLTYIGHSMGTTLSFVLLSIMPEYNEKIKFNICLSPVATWRHKQPPLFQFVINNAPLMQKIFQKNEVYEFLPLTKTGIRTGMTLCSEFSILQPICIGIIILVSGYDLDQLNKKALPYIFSYFPSGTSLQIAYHYYQNIASGEFQQFDYGGEKNFLTYGQEKPPLYNLQNVQTPVALIYGGGDVISMREDSEELKKHLPNVVTFEKVPHANFSHLDFLWAKNVRTLLNDRIIQLMSKFDNFT
ncbi:lipase 3-like [Leptopilina heterotoma]|uniref:lipase 3-like n=1 Tax=Leptopilina heterotoma TaxID=63436 RepID=UPI001CA9AEC4|nr:lipase 3-like [Leptopilina heterotoma]